MASSETIIGSTPLVAPAPLVVAIVSYRCRELLARCLDSVHSHACLDGVDAEVWVVDNGSQDGTAEMVRERHPHVRLIDTGANLGYARAVNIALRSSNTPLALVLNPDTELHAGTLPRLVEVLDHHPSVGIIGCRLVRADGSLDHAARRSFPTIAGALGHMTRIGRLPRAPRALAQYRAPDQEAGGVVDAVNGAFMLIRREGLDEVGLFDEGYWLYGEDLDLCYRFVRHGWQVYYEPAVSALHVKWGCSGSPRAPAQDRAFHHAMYRFYRTHYARDRNPVLNAAVYGAIAAKMGASLAAGELRRRRREIRERRDAAPQAGEVAYTPQAGEGRDEAPQAHELRGDAPQAHERRDDAPQAGELRDDAPQAGERRDDAPTARERREAAAQAHERAPATSAPQQ